MNRIRLAFLRWRRIVLEAEVANGEALMRDHAERLAVAKAALEEVERRMLVLRLSGNPQSLLAQAMRRHG
jgi:hypothetical protein